MHIALFQVAVLVLQLENKKPYAARAGAAGPFLHTLDSMQLFNNKVTVNAFPFVLPQLCSHMFVAKMHFFLSLYCSHHIAALSVALGNPRIAITVRN